MTQVSIIGTGTMGTAIAGVVTRGGNTVQLLAHADAATAVTGDVVVLAVPYPAVADVLAQRGGQLAGKVVVDITNPLNFETFDSLTVPADGSATAEIAAALPQSRVVKAFNTTFAATLAGGTVGAAGDTPRTRRWPWSAPRPSAPTTTVLIAGDDADAKSQVADVVTAAGLRAIDAGSLRRARELEGVGFLQITLAAGEKVAWTSGFAVIS